MKIINKNVQNSTITNYVCCNFKEIEALRLELEKAKQVIEEQRRLLEEREGEC